MIMNSQIMELLRIDRKPLWKVGTRQVDTAHIDKECMGVGPFEVIPALGVAQILFKKLVARIINN